MAGRLQRFEAADKKNAGDICYSRHFDGLVYLCRVKAGFKSFTNCRVILPAGSNKCI